MATVYVFSSCDRFASEDELREYVDATYSDDGDLVESAFMTEVRFAKYEPMCIEAVYASRSPLTTLLGGMSYCDQWLASISNEDVADAAICVFSPNEIQAAEKSSIRYHGVYEYLR